MRPFEDIFLGLGAEVLSFMSSALTLILIKHLEIFRNN